MKKPTHIKNPVWDQHKSWMNVMREGALTGIKIKRNKDAISYK